jgi:hypothetical protein
MRLLLLVIAATVTLGLAWGSVDTDPRTPEEPGTRPVAVVSASEPFADPDSQDEEEEKDTGAAREPCDPFERVVRSAPAPGFPCLVVDLVCAETGRRLVGGRLRLDGLGALPFEDGAFRLGAVPFRAPAGHVMERPGDFDLTVDVTRYTKEIRARVVAWPEADLRVVVTEADGSAAVGATVDRFLFRQCLRSFDARATDRLGVARVPGVPAIPGEPVRVLARKGDREAASPRVSVGRSTEETWASVVLPPGPGRASLYCGPAGEVPGSYRDPRHAKPRGNATLRIELRRVDGRPAHGARLVEYGVKDSKRTWRAGGRADGDGMFLLPGLPPGPATVRVHEDGFLMAREAPVTVRAGTVTDLVVDEDPGRPLDVRVVDPRGRPIAGAALSIYSINAGDYIRLEGDVQHIGFYTDREGRYRIPRLPEGRVLVKVRLGSRKVRKWTEAGGTLELVIPD